MSGITLVPKNIVERKKWIITEAHVPSFQASERRFLTDFSLESISQQDRHEAEIAYAAFYNRPVISVARRIEKATDIPS